MSSIGIWRALSGTKKGSRLTRKRVERLAKEWRALGLSVEPINRRAVRSAVVKLYRAHDYQDPEHVICLDSPASCLMAIRQIRNSDQTKTRLKTPLRIGVPGRSRLFHAYLISHRRRHLWPLLLQTNILSNIGQVQLQALTATWDRVPSLQFKNHFNTHVKPKLQRQLGHPIDDISNRCWLRLDKHLHGTPCIGAHHQDLSHLDLEIRFNSNIARSQRREQVAYLNYARKIGWGIFFADYAFISDRPETIHIRDDFWEVVHSEDGPAIQYRDGWNIYAWRGNAVPRSAIEEPVKISVDQVLNAEGFDMQRFLLERMTPERFIRQGGAQAVARDRFGTLWKKRLARDDMWCAVEVINGTPEKDGSYQHFYIQVPSEVVTARQAVAWTYGMLAEDYNPNIRT